MSDLNFHNFIFVGEYAWDPKMDNSWLDLVITHGIDTDNITKVFHIRRNSMTGHYGKTYDEELIKKLLRAAWTGRIANLDVAKKHLTA